MLLVGIVYEWMALKMPQGTFAYPGPGLFPIIVGVFLLATALGCLVQEFLPRRAATPAPLPLPVPAPPAAATPPEAPGQPRAVHKTYQLTALTVAYILLLKPVGFPICMCAFLAVAIRIFGFRRWLPTAVLAVVITAASYVSFVMWLKVPLPMGFLDEILG